MSKCVNNVIVFDLDDTIGHFEELSIFRRITVYC